MGGRSPMAINDIKSSKFVTRIVVKFATKTPRVGCSLTRKYSVALVMPLLLVFGGANKSRTFSL